MANSNVRGQSLGKLILKRMLYSFSITNWIIFINVILFIALSFFGEDFLINNIAFSWQNLQEGRVWTLLTNVFMHGSFSHLFFNMFSLFFIGNFVEKLIGRKRFTSFYLLAGIFAALFFGFLAFSFGDYLPSIFSTASTPAVGASGAIFGLLGLLAMIAPRGKVYLLLGPLIAVVLAFALENFVSSGILSVINILLTIYIFLAIFSMFTFNIKRNKIALPVEMPFWLLPIVAIVPLVIIGFFIPLPIGNMAHLGGLIAGLIFGAYLRGRYKKKIELLNRMLERRG